MKVAISMCCLHDFFVRQELEPLSFVKYATSLVVDGVEICDQYLRNLGDLEELRQTLQETDLAVASYALTTEPTDLPSWQKEFEIAQQLGTSIIRVPSLGERGTQLIPYLEKLGISLSVDKGELPLDSPTPYLQRTLAMAEVFLQGHKPSNQIGLVQANDLRLDPENGGKYIGSVLGLGLVEVEQILISLKEQDYSGWLLVDYFGAENPFFGLEASLKNLRQYLREI